MADIVNDIFGAIADFCSKAYDKIKSNANAAFFEREFGDGVQSVNKLAKKSIFYFPVIATDSCSGEALQKIVTFIERKNAIYIKLIIERIGVIDLKSGDTREDVIKKVKGFDRGFEESQEFSFRDTPNTIVLNENPTQKHSSSVRKLLKDSENIEILGEARNNNSSNNKNNSNNNNNNNTPRNDNSTSSGMFNGRPIDKRERDNFPDEFKRLQNNRRTEEANKKQFFYQLAMKNARNFGDSRVVHRSGNTLAEIQDKKINMAEPTQIRVNFSYYVKGVCTMSSSSVDLGVKSMLHVVDATETQELIPKSRIDDTKWLIKLAKLVSKETSFFRDFVFNVKTIKKYITGDNGGQNNWINKLKYMTSQNKYRKHLGNQILPTYSLVLSTEDVETMRMNTNGKFDLFIEKQAKMLIESLSLLNLIIVDDANERVFWLEDSQKQYDIMSFTALDRESRNLSQSDLMKVLLKIGNK